MGRRNERGPRVAIDQVMVIRSVRVVKGRIRLLVERWINVLLSFLDV